MDHTSDDLQNAIDSLDGVPGSNELDVVLDNYGRALEIVQSLRSLAIALIQAELRERKTE